jgi:hypothetical protein
MILVDKLKINIPFHLTSKHRTEATLLMLTKFTLEDKSVLKGRRMSGNENGKGEANYFRRRSKGTMVGSNGQAGQQERAEFK